MKEKDYANKRFDQIRKASWNEIKPVYDISGQETVKIDINPDTSISRGKFMPDPKRSGAWVAHPVTIRAMRNDIFMVDSQVAEFEQLFRCESCKEQLDLQFWILCPFCEKEFPKHVNDILVVSTNKDI